MNDNLASLKLQLENAKRNWRIIQERKSEYIETQAIPLDLIKNERYWEQEIVRLEQVIAEENVRIESHIDDHQCTQSDSGSPVDDSNPVLCWLKAQGFNTNPFETINAGDEEDILPSFFVKVWFFESLIGNTREPDNLILFADRGLGKTSHRIEIARHARGHGDAPALAVVFTEFDILLAKLEASEGSLSTAAYPPVILKRTLETLTIELENERWRWKKLQDDREIYTQFCALKQLYINPTPLPDQPDITDAWVQYFRQHVPGFHETLTILVAIATQAGFASIHFLVDGVDEFAETSNNPEKVLELLRPLLDMPGNPRKTRFAFKFFLPLPLESLMQKRNTGRLDRIQSYRLEWSPEQLQGMLSQRLTSCSQISTTDSRGRVHRFSVLCEEEVDVDDMLVKAAWGVPRDLIRLCRDVIYIHCNELGINDDSTLITMQTVREVLKRWGREESVS